MTKFGLWWLTVVTILHLCQAHNVIFEDGYDKQSVPGGLQQAPLPVNFSLNLRNILSVDEKSSLISLEISLRMFWTDPGVRPNNLPENSQYVVVTPEEFTNFWIPDIFIDRAKAVRGPTYFKTPASIRVYNDSRLRFSKRINFDVACPMDFHLYPVDKQRCEIKFESFGRTSKELNLKWIDGAFKRNPNISLAQFLWEADLQDSYETDYYELQYPGVILTITLQRQLPYHVCQTYVPSIIIVSLAWLSMFVSPDSIPGRVAFGMTTLLTMTAMFGAVRSNVPRVSYVTLLDVWMIVSIVFVFLSLLEFTLVATLIRKGQRHKSERLEQTCRVLFPLLYLVFNILYWTFLLMQM